MTAFFDLKRIFNHIKTDRAVNSRTWIRTQRVKRGLWRNCSIAVIFYCYVCWFYEACIYMLGIRIINEKHCMRDVFKPRRYKRTPK